MEFEGIVTVMGAIETVTTSKGEAQKVTFVVEEESDRERKNAVVCEQFGEKQVEVAKMIAKGDKVKVYINPRAREYNGRWYNSISARKVDVIEKGNGETVSSGSSDTDLPF